MLNYTFENLQGETLYEHLYNCIRADIQSGKLAANEKLPSKRALSRQLSISVMTIENAYQQLLSEGFIYSAPRRGFFVAETEVESRKTSLDTPPVSFIEESIPDHPDYFVDFSSNGTNPNDFPFVTWAKLTRRVLADDRELLMENSPSNGLYELRRAIAESLVQFRGMNVSPDCIVVGAGTETLYTILLQLLGRNRVYATENPGYQKIVKLLNANEIANIPIAIDDSGISTSMLAKSKASVAHITPSHHFPTGITMPVRRRNELLAWADVTRGYIIEDEYDSEFRMLGRPIPSLFSMDHHGRVIYMNTFTKSLASTIRVSYMVLPVSLMQKYYKLLSFYSCPVSTFEQLTLADFITQGYYEKHINRMRTMFRRKRDLLMDAIKNSPLADHSRIREENAGLHFVIELDLKISDDAFLNKLAREDIHLLPLAAYGTSHPHAFLINYSSIPEERIEEAVARLAKCLAD